MEHFEDTLYSVPRKRNIQQDTRHTSAHRLVLRLLGISIALYGSLLLWPVIPLVHADGGAPNLAYVAGGGNGISVIDIAQQKVTRNFALSGNPAMLYLTLDGRYLYVAQPDQNKVSMLDTSSGKLVCSVTVP